MIRMKFEYNNAICRYFVKIGIDYNNVDICVNEFRNFFILPRKIDTIELVFTKRPHLEAYRLNVRYSHGWRACILDTFDVALLYEARKLFFQMRADGYNYVRCEYTS